MIIKFGCIVEGHGEVQSVPVLIRRIAAELYPKLVIDIPRPIRVHRDQVVKIDELEREIELAAQKVGGRGGILVVLDSDNVCPAELGPTLLGRSLQARSDLPIAVVIAKNEFEAWFLAAADSLRGKRGLRDDIYPPNHPEAIRGAKEWLHDRMQSGKTYRSKRDQPALATLFDIEQARQVDSFDKCYRDIVRLLEELQEASDPISEQA